jgi:antitoxin CcdA
MTQRQRTSAARKAKSPANVSIPVALLKEAKSLDINISRAAAVGIAAEVARLKGSKWREENREALEYYNEWIRDNGLPLEKLRLF